MRPAAPLAVSVLVRDAAGHPATNVEVTVAAIDRLVHHATIIEMNSDSYRRRAAADRLAPRADAVATPSADKPGDSHGYQAADSVTEIGRQIVGRQLDVAPTLTIQPGFTARILVTRDLVLEPYGEGR